MTRACRRHVGDPGREAGAERVQQELDRCRPLVLADEDGRVVRVVPNGRACMWLEPAPLRRFDDGAAVGALDPAVAGAELELGELRRSLDRVDRRRAWGVDAVERTR